MTRSRLKTPLFPLLLALGACAPAAGPQTAALATPAPTSSANAAPTEAGSVTPAPAASASAAESASPAQRPQAKLAAPPSNEAAPEPAASAAANPTSPALSPSSASAVALTPPASLAEQYERAHHGQTPSASATDNDPRARENTFGFTEIAFERSACFGRCPVYTVLIKADGSLSYVGRANTKRQGVHAGTIYPSGFAYLAQLANDLGIEALKDRYAAGVTDNPTSYIALTRGGKKKLIMHYAPSLSGPPRLFAFENEIERVLERAEWQ